MPNNEQPTTPESGVPQIATELPLSDSPAVKKPVKRTRKVTAPTIPSESAGDSASASESAARADQPATQADQPEKPAKAPRRAAKKATATKQESLAEVITEAPAAPKRATKRSANKIAPLQLSHVPAAIAAIAAPEVSSAPAMTAPAPLALFMAPEDAPVKKRPATKRAEPPSKDEADAPTVDATAEDEDKEQSTQSDDGDTSTRRRRGRRGRSRSASTDETLQSQINTADEEKSEGKSRSEQDQKTAAPTGDASENQPDESKLETEDNARGGRSAEKNENTNSEDEDEGSGTRRRRRRRRRGDEDSAEENETSEPASTRNSDSNKVRGVSGSVRLEAKRQRRKEGRDAGRRRAPILTEAEFLARRESVKRSMLVRQQGDRTQIAVLEDDVLAEHYVTLASEQSFAGGIYLGRVQNVLPSMEAAFMDIGKKRNAVLYAGEVNWEAAGLEGKARNIERALKSGDKVLVQVTKDPIGHKGARLSSQISLPGRFLVYVPGSSMTGISRKLPEGERRRLKEILRSIIPEDAGVIVRTAAEGASEEELTHDVQRLQAQWELIEKKVNDSGTKAPSALYEEPDLAIRVVRDLFNEDFESMVVSGDEAWETISSYVEQVAPDLTVRLSKYTGTGDIFTDNRIDEQLAKALDRKVFLPSGGSLVIDNTEAMTVIDVNTGKFTGSGGNLEQTVTKNNLEAAEEIVRQLRLRDVGGIVVIDFIDMLLESNRDLVLRRLTECLGRDRTKHQVAEVTSLGLIQMTRKRVGQGLLDAFSEPCPHCNGRGVQVFGEPVDKSDSSEDSDNFGGNDRARGRRGRGRGDNRADGRSDKGQGNGQPDAEEKKVDPPKDSSAKISQIANSMKKLDEAVAEQTATNSPQATTLEKARSASFDDESGNRMALEPSTVSTPQESSGASLADSETAEPSRPAARRRRTARRPAGSPQHVEAASQS
ncbi:MAG: Rne/Rng family ribonuclease [Antricoccus sp.]